MAHRTKISPMERLLIEAISDGGSSQFASDIKAGLSSHPKATPPKYFYDDLGSHLFEAICCLPEYYLTRAEREILRTSAGEIVREAARSINGDLRLVELGNGSAEKTRYIIEALLSRQTTLDYIPIDISLDSLRRSSDGLLYDYKSLYITALAGDYANALKRMQASGVPGGHGHGTLVLFLGSNIGNYDPHESISLLKEIRGILRPGDGLLLGADLVKAPATLIAAYNDALGVTAAFNLNLLVRINREAGGDFDLAHFRHKAIYNQEESRVEMHLESLEEQTVRLHALDLEVRFARGETIHTENSYKFDVARLDALALGTGFRLQKTWFDKDRLFSFNLFVAA